LSSCSTSPFTPRPSSIFLRMRVCQGVPSRSGSAWRPQRSARPVHALLDLDGVDWRPALRELERLGASSGRALALGVGVAAAALGARRPAAHCATLPV